MSFDYDRIQAIADAQLKNFGRDAVLQRVTEGAFDPASGSVSGASNSSETVKAVITEYKERQIDGTVIRRGDRMALISGAVLEPQPNDILDDMKVINVELVRPADVTVLYKVQVRR